MLDSIKAIIIDDEFQNQILLRDLVQDYGQGFEILRIFSNVKDGAAFINQNKIDVVFLDIEMPEQIGLELFNLCGANKFITIIVSAYDHYALPAIKEGVFDYLLKPIELAELRKTLKKVQLELQNTNKQERIRLLINGKIELITPSDIIFIEAAGAYTKFIFKNRPATLQSHHLAHFEKILPTPLFIRVHRSNIINSAAVVSIDKSNNLLLMEGEHQVTYSSRRWATIKQFI